jgi:hypothetical protein
MAFGEDEFQNNTTNNECSKSHLLTIYNMKKLTTQEILMFNFGLMLLGMIVILNAKILKITFRKIITLKYKIMK